MTDYKLVPLEPTEAMIDAARDIHEGEKYLPVILYTDIYKAMLAAAPDVQGEPVAWSGWGCQYPGKVPRLYGDHRIAELNCDRENGDQVLYFTAAPQPAEQKPDVTQLVEALEKIASWPVGVNFCGQLLLKQFAEGALAAYRKQGGSND